MCRPTSTSLGLMVHIAQSFVGKVLSSCAMCPPMADLFSTRYTLKPDFGQIERGLHPRDAAADDHHSAGGLLGLCIVLSAIVLSPVLLQTRRQGELVTLSSCLRVAWSPWIVR